MHPKYWKPARLMAPLDSEGSAGGGESLVDAFAAHFEAPTPDDQQQQAAPESQEDAAARLAAEDAAKANAQPEAQTQADEQQDVQATQKFTIEVDGKPVELTKEEIAEHYKAGLRQSDYTQKTMALAEQRKAVESEAAKARTAREEYAGKLEAFTGQVNYEVNALKAQLTDELLQSDPVAYLQIQRTAEMRQAQLQQAQREMEQINAQRSQEKAQADAERAADQQAKLLAKVPAWKDPAKAKIDMTALQEYLVKEGYSNEGDSLPQYLQISLALKAMQYDALMARAASTKANVEKAPPKVERPGVPVSPTDGRTAAMKELAATGSRDAAAKIFAEMFG